MKNAEIFARVEPQLKDGAIKIFKKRGLPRRGLPRRDLPRLGIARAESINLFLDEIVIQQGFPFPTRTPNQETLDTMKKTDDGKELTEYEDVNDFYREIGIKC